LYWNIQIDNDLTAWFKLLLGVHQEYVQSLHIFYLCSEMIKHKNKNIKMIIGGVNINNLNADDTILNISSEKDL